MKYNPREFKVVALRECPVDNPILDEPEQVTAYWRRHIATEPRFNPDVESLAVLMLNSRRRIKGHHIVATGTLDTVITHSREVFRAAIVSAAAAVVLVHNHPSGDPTPSEADVKMTRDLMRAGQLLKIELLDHVVVGAPDAQPKGYASIRALGYFFQ
jgi:DNA repair protein RadC